MSIEQKIYNALQALVSGRCYPDVLPQAVTFPAICYQKISDEPHFSTSTLNRFTDFHFQITVHATTKQAAVDVRAQVLLAAEAMPEYITRLPGLGSPFEFQPKTYTEIMTFQFYDAET